MSIHAPQSDHASGRASQTHGVHPRPRAAGASVNASSGDAGFAGLLQAQADQPASDAPSWPAEPDATAQDALSSGAAGPLGLLPALAQGASPSTAVAQTQADEAPSRMKAKSPVSLAQQAQNAPEFEALQTPAASESTTLTRASDALAVPSTEGAVGAQSEPSNQPFELIQRAQDASNIEAAGRPMAARGVGHTAAPAQPADQTLASVQTGPIRAEAASQIFTQKQPITPVTRAQMATNTIANSATQTSLQGSAALGAREGLERVLAAVGVERALSPDPVAMTAALVGAMGPEGHGPTAHAPERGSSIGANAPEASPTWLGQASSNGADGLRSDQQVLGAGDVAQTAAPEDAVRYWSAGAIDHAQVRVDGWGDAPLDVQIDLQAGQATIDFRTDQPELRAALNESTQPLRELLADQGLQLAGVSVGTSGQETARRWAQSEQQTQQSPAGAGGVRRSAAVAASLPVATPRRALQGAGQTLDVFA